MTDMTHMTDIVDTTDMTEINTYDNWTSACYKVLSRYRSSQKLCDSAFMAQKLMMLLE